MSKYTLILDRTEFVDNFGKGILVKTIDDINNNKLSEMKIYPQNFNGFSFRDFDYRVCGGDISPSLKEIKRCGNSLSRDNILFQGFEKKLIDEFSNVFFIYDAENSYGKNVRLYINKGKIQYIKKNKNYDYTDFYFDDYIRSYKIINQRNYKSEEYK